MILRHYYEQKDANSTHKSFLVVRDDDDDKTIFGPSTRPSEVRQFLLSHGFSVPDALHPLAGQFTIGLTLSPDEMNAILREALPTPAQDELSAEEYDVMRDRVESRWQRLVDASTEFPDGSKEEFRAACVAWLNGQ